MKLKIILTVPVLMFAGGLLAAAQPTGGFDNGTAVDNSGTGSSGGGTRAAAGEDGKTVWKASGNKRNSGGIIPQAENDTTKTGERGHRHHYYGRHQFKPGIRPVYRNERAHYRNYKSAHRTRPENNDKRFTNRSVKRPGRGYHSQSSEKRARNHIKQHPEPAEDK